MENFGRSLAVLILVAAVIGFFANFNPRFPKLPGDALIDRPGFRIYIPFASAIVVSIILIILLNMYIW